MRDSIHTNYRRLPKEDINYAMELASRSPDGAGYAKYVQDYCHSDSTDLRSDCGRIYDVFNDAVSVPVRRTYRKLLMGFAIDVLSIHYDENNYACVIGEALEAAESLASYMKAAGNWEDL